MNSLTVPFSFLTYFKAIRIVVFQAVGDLVLLYFLNRIYLSHQFLKKKFISIVIDSSIEYIKELHVINLFSSNSNQFINLLRLTNLSTSINLTKTVDLVQHIFGNIINLEDTNHLYIVCLLKNFNFTIIAQKIVI